MSQMTMRISKEMRNEKSRQNFMDTLYVAVMIVALISLIGSVISFLKFLALFGKADYLWFYHCSSWWFISPFILAAIFIPPVRKFLIES